MVSHSLMKNSTENQKKTNKPNRWGVTTPPISIMKGIDSNENNIINPHS